MILALALFLGCAAAPTCAPACAPGQDCAKVESCNDLGCSASYVCEGTPDDCQTNGCEKDHHACRWSREGWSCVEKTCETLPWSYNERPYDWRCNEWAESGCCLDWRLVEEGQ